MRKNGVAPEVSDFLYSSHFIMHRTKASPLFGNSTGPILVEVIGLAFLKMFVILPRLNE
jgi:hypothetical protein